MVSKQKTSQYAKGEYITERFIHVLQKVEGLKITLVGREEGEKEILKFKKQKQHRGKRKNFLVRNKSEMYSCNVDSRIRSHEFEELIHGIVKVFHC